MINSMRGCVACDDLWPWPISSRSFGLDLENRVRFVASTVLDGFFSDLAQMITINRGCVACYIFFRIRKFEFLANFWNFSALTFHIWYKWSLAWEGVSHVMTFDLDLYLQGHLAFVASTVLDGFFSYVAQMIAINRGCVACYVFFRIRKFEFLANFWNFSALTLKKKSSVLNWFFPYLAQMITSKRRCVAYNDLWPWPISSRSFGLGLENRVCSVASTVLDGFFPYLIQMITSMRRCVACDDLWTWPISSRSFDLEFECPLCNVFSSRSIISIFATNNHYH